MERAVRLELTIPDLQSGALAAWRRAQVGTEGEIRTLESSLEDSHVSSYITSASLMKRNGRGGQNRTVATSAQDSDASVTPHPDLKTRGTERTRTVIGLVDNQVPHLSATAPNISNWRLPIANCQLALAKQSSADRESATS